MIEKSQLEKLASLARIAVSEEEKTKLEHDLESILNYVSELKNAPDADSVDQSPLKNVMREDDENFASGQFTEEILSQAPDRSDNYFKVKKIFN